MCMKFDADTYPSLRDLVIVSVITYRYVIDIDILHMYIQLYLYYVSFFFFSDSKVCKNVNKCLLQ